MFAKITSLGAWCSTAHQIKAAGLKRSKSLFDWNFTPVNTTLNLIENDFHGFFERERLQIVPDRYTVREASGMYVHHIFPRDVEGRIDADQFDAAYPAARDTVADLIQGWRQDLIDPEPRLYVWALTPEWTVGTTARAAAERFMSLIGARAAHPATLLVVQEERWHEPDWGLPNVLQRAVPPYVGPEHMRWTGHEEGWRAIFAGLALAPSLSHAA
ncbi:DUF1796 family putative cysteine peptidase [Methylobacterium isbiliense]|uniref:Papain-like cysteine peptidase n=1 Tax=Methylobacterium isbiliense TaxID=315478 RepID=A0ABQ4SBY7_9HYPH|nr:DUF1796 family putative cysteine peptidase [Methylobacterium isbiliense]MDN3622620.1 DUF1796 family putative cysteine peptidase [Methylobacterium isbiliense]GJE00532.1 hypothetical protein GMJLKIPL_2455 [Methylobacterium isbiliense]